MDHHPLENYEDVLYLFHHLFLPPKLPQEDDYGVDREILLIDVVVDALHSLKPYFSAIEAEVIGLASTMIIRLRQIHGPNGEMDEVELKKMLRRLNEEGELEINVLGIDEIINKSSGGFLPIYVREQNAAILISNKGRTTHIECFELSAANEAVMSTKGRLQRTFPGPTLAFDSRVMNEPDLLMMLAQTISRMSQQPVAGTVPKVRKADQKHDEDRDTTDPKMVVDFLMATLRPSSTDVTDKQILKHSREEVMWRDCRSPWRRSALWLLIRVALQLVFSRLSDGRGPSQLYKGFMIYLKGSVIERMSKLASHEMLHLMAAKVVRRLLKLASAEEPAWFAPIRSILQHVGDRTQVGWQRLVDHDDRQIDFESLKELEFMKATECSLPQLDSYLRDLTRKSDENHFESFEPSPQLTFFESGNLPMGSGLCDPEYTVQNLCGFEDWVESCLGNWMNDHLEDAPTCSQLGRLISEYHAVALRAYQHNPEAISTMLLTLLELWIACDKSAIRSHPHLKDYDPCIPTGCFYSLLLPFKSQMMRLARAEEYLDQRHKQIRYPGPGIFHEFGTRSCFSVRYFDQSDEHQRLLRNIEEQASHARDRKRTELAEKQARYTDLITLASETECQYEDVLLDRRFDFRESRHSHSCPCHRYRSQANSIKIDIHEWPLPTDSLRAKSTVFELRVPESFGGWRDTTLYMLQNCLGVVYSKIEKPRSEYRLKKYQGLSSFFSCSTDQRLCLLSQIKPHQNTHRRKKLIIHVAEDDICLNNALHFQYFDNNAGCFVSNFEREEKTEIRCTYQLPHRCSTLQKFLFRPASQPHGVSPNTVIATQNAAPVEMSLAEYKALATMPLGLEIQWHNILLELSMPSVDMKKVESAIFFRQIVNQAGMPSTDTWMRRGHAILCKPDFTAKLLSSIGEAAERMKENWNLVHGYHTLIHLLLRILSLSPCETDRRRCLGLLSSMRQKAFQWVETVRKMASQETDDARKVDLVSKAVHIALVCVQTFDTETHLQSFALPSDVSIFLRCCMIIWNGRDSLPLEVGSLQRILYYRWQVLCYHSRAVMAEKCSNTSPSPMDTAILGAWAAYPAGSTWSKVSPSLGYWLHSMRSEPAEECDRMHVHYNLLTGELLVNGLPLAHLPAEYMSNQAYRTLFGERSQLEVMPSDQPGMQFSCRAEYCGHTVHLGMTPVPESPRSDLSIKAARDDQAWHFVPPRLFSGHFPDDFVHKYAHWYAIDRGDIEFRPLSSPWVSSEHHWRLRRGISDNTWRLENQEYQLVGSRSKTADILARLFSPLEKPSEIHERLDKVKSTLHIDLPRLRLEFILPDRSTSVQCRQYPGTIIDAKQACNSLVGLHSKLILVNPDSRQRIVLIPEGDVVWSKAGDHVQVNVVCEGQWHAYSIDERLGRLVDNGSLQSKLLLAYLHALTSYFLPDPLTRRTGTEQALSILRSASVRSFDRLRPENVAILSKIAALTPQRRFYPDNEQVMQSVEWRHALGCLSQHPGFYDEVAAIRDQNSRVVFYYPGEEPATPSLPKIDRHLLLRDQIRTSSFRVSRFGAEDHTRKHDHHYASRDANRSSANSTRAFKISKMLCDRISRTRKIESEHWFPHLWKFLSTSCAIRGPGPQMESAKLRYSAEWMLTSRDFLVENWCAIHHLVSSQDRRLNKYQLLIWLSTIAYSAQADMIVVETIASLYLNPEIMCEYTAIRGQFQPEEGFEWDRGTIQALIQSAHLDSTPEDRLEPLANESYGTFGSRIKKLRKQNRTLACKTASDHFSREWPTHSPSRPTSQEALNLDDYLNIPKIMAVVTEKFSIWEDNRQLRQCLTSMVNQLCGHPVKDIQPPSYPQLPHPQPAQSRRGDISFDDLMTASPLLPDIEEPQLPDLLREGSKTIDPTGDLVNLIDSMDSYTNSPYEEWYVKLLRDSVRSFADTTRQNHFTVARDNLERSVGTYLVSCERYVRDVYTALISRLLPPGPIDRSPTSSPFKSTVSALAFRIHHAPRLSTILLLEQLSRHEWPRLAIPWRKSFILYGRSITMLQRAERLCRLIRSPEDFLKELRNPGHTNWDPFEKPENLLLEIENGILIRANQENIARTMTWSARGQNIVLQLNMGDGKSSVAVPIVAVAHANGRSIARVLTPKPQSRQMHQMLVGKLGGLLDRRVYQLPFSRSLNLGEAEVNEIQRMCHECMSNGGVLLVQPEHILSLKLMCLECFIAGKTVVGRSLLRILNFFREYACDIIDESDETFNAKFELIYSMGAQRPVELSPQRWVLIQELLHLVRVYASQVKVDLPDSIEVIHQEKGGFPRIRVLDGVAEHALLHRIATHICENGIGPLPIARQPHVIRQAVLVYILKPKPTADEISAVESDGAAGFWGESIQSHLLLVRGLLAGGVLAFCLGRKRWRVNYGPDPRRDPPTRLAVPYRAKDSPSLRSEFSHPDVVILLTCLQYYYSGLTNDEISLAFDHLAKSDEAEAEYQAWAQDAPMLEPDFQQLVSVNLDDEHLCANRVFPALRLSKATVDYFLAQIVFPKEMKEFADKLSSSGWDTGELRTNPTVGFSGTNDNRKTLPLTVGQLDLPEQEHTNALVLECLMRRENSVVDIPTGHRPAQSDAHVLLDLVTKMDQPTRVILDVGAQILELTNLEVARQWLNISQNDQTQGAIFVNDQDNICVVDTKGRVELLQTSPFAFQMEACLVFLDEAHTRGIDLKLPVDYRAAVTLGPGITKDKLVQACMRMRKLGYGQSVIFCIPCEIKRQIVSSQRRDENPDIDVSDVLRWAILETWKDVRCSVPLWAVQGCRFAKQQTKWKDYQMQDGVSLTPEQSQAFLEPECQTLEQRYRPSHNTVQQMDTNIEVFEAIHERCGEVGGLALSSSLDEEQERELAPEIQTEREDQRPPAAQPAAHRIRNDLVSFIESGMILQSSKAYQPAFLTLHKLSAASQIDLDRFHSNLLATTDFTKTIQCPEGSSFVADAYQRSVRFILSTVPSFPRKGDSLIYMMIISPYEANVLMPAIGESKAVALHVYAPRQNREFAPLDRLMLYTTPPALDMGPIPGVLRMQLNLFAGQLYLESYGDYQELCTFLGVASTPTPAGLSVAADGFIHMNANGTFSRSPLRFIKFLLSQIRKDCRDIRRTHLGRIVDGQLLTRSDLEESALASTERAIRQLQLPST